MNFLNIANEKLKLTVLPGRGGIVSSLKWKNQEILRLTDEFIEDSSGWPAGGIPLLFPVAGRSFVRGVAGRYEAFGKEWPMPIHGFAYGMPWLGHQLDAQSIELYLTSTEATEAIYPWRFKIKHQIRLRDNQLELKASITHINCLQSEQMPMLIAPGYHPYFDTRSGQALDHQKLKIKFNPKSMIRVSATGAVDKETDVPQLDFYPSDFQAIHNGIFPVTGKKTVELETEKLMVIMQSSTAENFVFWTPDASNFHCIEPWAGVPDAFGFSNVSHLNQSQNHPFAAIALAENQTYDFNMSLTFEDKT